MVGQAAAEGWAAAVEAVRDSAWEVEMEVGREEVGREEVREAAETAAVAVVEVAAAAAATEEVPAAVGSMSKARYVSIGSSP